jgi:hypothetical protein
MPGQRPPCAQLSPAARRRPQSPWTSVPGPWSGRDWPEKRTVITPCDHRSRHGAVQQTGGYGLTCGNSPTATPPEQIFDPGGVPRPPTHRHVYLRRFSIKPRPGQIFVFSQVKCAVLCDLVGNSRCRRTPGLFIRPTPIGFPTATPSGSPLLATQQTRRKQSQLTC